jgi:hypothetical protein
MNLLRAIVLVMVLLAASAAALAAEPASSPKPLTDEAIVKAIEKAKAYLLAQQKADGLWPEQGADGEGDSEMAIWALRCAGLHPVNSESLAKAFAADTDRPLKTTRAVSLRAMAFYEAVRFLASPFSASRRDKLKDRLTKDAVWLIAAQGKSGGWGPASLAGGDGATNLGDTLWALRGLGAALMGGVEVPMAPLERARAVLLVAQQADGSWPAETGQPGDVAVTCDALAALVLLDRYGAAGNLSDAGRNEPIMRAVEWLMKAGATGPASGGGLAPLRFYGGARASLPGALALADLPEGRREAAARLVRSQKTDGSWGDIQATCLAAVSLHEACWPLTFAKMALPGCEWNARSWDIGNLTNYMSRHMQQYFAWEIVGLDAPPAVLHQAPVLVLAPSDPPTLSDKDKKTLRAFTDTGGTILVLDPGGVVVGAWFQRFAKEVWPEWAVKPLAAGHATFQDPNPIKTAMPEILGVDDGLCTRVFFGPFGAGQAWQENKTLARVDMFKWGLNLFRYATDARPVMSWTWPPAAAEPKPRVSEARPAGGKTVRLSRLKYGGNWMVGRNYKGFDVIAAALTERLGVTLKVDESGVDPGDLAGADVAYLAGSESVVLAPKAQADLKAYLAKGGFLWVEAAGGAQAFDGAMLRLALDMGWTLQNIEKTHPLMTGQFKSAAGYDLTKDVKFQRALRIPRLGRPWAELVGIYQGERMVGVYSPFDAVFSASGYPAYGCRGYAPEDAKAVAANLLLGATDRPDAAP